ncbi:MAG TPA: alpha/beta fold hydrolase [Gemmatimonadaceae bacterium]|nr:alpha/beta fold hydrolase [Gemmatimonadaceae bacterium]
MGTDPKRVVLLHGLGRSARSMHSVERALAERGYRVLNVGYRSRTADIDTLAVDVAGRARAWANGDRTDFVTHSLGGILLRVAVAREYVSLPQVGRVVMLGPPNGGSELADVLPQIPLFGWIYRRFTGPAGLQLGTRNGVPRRLPPVSFDLGVIAGSRSYNPLFSAILSGANDGKVRVESARVQGMRDFLVVPHWHPLLMVAPAVVAQIVHYLETGSFRRNP